MTPADQLFADELEIFRKEVASATQFLYMQLVINHLARRSERTLQALNRRPLFWNTVVAGLETAAFIAIGRIFDQDTPHNIDTVLRLTEGNRAVFSKQALAERKRKASSNADEWLSDYLVSVHVPTAKDIRKLRRRVAERRRLYEAQFRPLRHKFFAHKVAASPDEIAVISANAKIRDLELLVGFLNQLHETLWQMFHNGARPVLRPMPSSAARLVHRRLNEWHNRVQEIAVFQTKGVIRGLVGRRDIAKRSKSRTADHSSRAP